GRAEEGQRLVVAEERERGVGDEEAVAHELNLGVAALGAVREVNGNFLDAEAALDGLDGQLGLDLEAAAEERQPLDEGAVEGAVAGEDVGEAHGEDGVQGRAHEAVAPAVELAELALR